MAEIDLKKNILLSGSFRIVIIALTFCISWISARFLGVELKGQYSYVITLGGFFWMVLDLGIFHSYPYLARKFPQRLANLYGWTVFSTSLEIAVLLALGLGFRPFWNQLLGYEFSPLYLILFVLYVSFTKALMQLKAFFIGLDRILNHSLAAVINSSLCLLLVSLGFLLVSGTTRLTYYLGITVFSLAAAITYLLASYGQAPRLGQVDLGFVRRAYGFGIRAFVSALLISLLVRADIVIVKQLLGYRQTGIYSIAAHIVDFLQIASNMVGGLLLAKLSDTASDIGKWLLMKKMLMLFAVFLALGNLAFVALGRPLLALFYGAGFVPSYWVYLWLIPASFGLSFGSLFQNYLNSKGFPIVSIIIAALALALNIGLNFLLIPGMGIQGAALATSVAYLFWFALIVAYEQRQSQGRLLRHLLPRRADWKELKQMLAATLATGWNRLRKR